MNKLFTKIVGTCLGLAMAVGTGVAVGIGSSKEAVPVNAASTTDTLNRATTGITGTSYSNWSGKTVTSDAVYAGNSAGGNSSIQLRSNSPSGIWTTASGGTIKSVSVSWNSNTASGRTLNVYGSNSAYSTQPSSTLVGTIVCGTSTSYSFTTDYSYVAVKSNSGAMYLDSISFVWEVSTATKHNLTYAAGSQGTYDGSTTKTFEVAEEATHTVKSPSDVGISANTGYLFNGWNDGTNTYATGSSYTMGTSDVTLTAQWEAGVGLSYNANSGTGSTATTYVVSGGTQIVSANGFTAPSGMQFKEWNTNSSGTGTSYNPGDEIENFTSGLELFAIWETATHVTFDATVDTGTSPFTKSDITLTLSSGALNNGTDYRVYKNATLEISRSSGKISSIEFTCIASGTTQYGPGCFAVEDGEYSYSGTKGTWEGAATSVTFTASSNQVRATQIVVNYYTGADVDLDKTTLVLTAGGSSSTVKVDSISGVTNPEYSWSNTSGDDCVTLTNTDTDTVTVAPKGSKFASCTLTLSVSGSNLASPVIREAKVYVARTSSSSSPYDIPEAKHAIDLEESTYLTSAYVEGIVSQLDSYASGAITYWISNDGTTSNQLEAYKGKGLSGASFTALTDLSLGDSVVVTGNLTKYNTTYEFAQDNQLYSHTTDSVTLSISGQTTSFTQGEYFSLGNAVITATYAVSGAQTIANDSALLSFTIEGDELTTSTVLTVADHNTGEVQITYEDANGKTASLTYTISVSYASVSSVTLNYHNLTVEPVSETNFSVTLNSNVDPNSEAEWEVTNKAGSSLDLQNYGIMSTGNLTATLTAIGDSTDSGTLIVTATVGSVSDTCEVTVTGDAYVTFDKDSVEGIVGATLNNSVTVTPVGLGTPTGYTWSIKSGEATDVVNATSGGATSTLTFLKAGSTVLHVVVTDGTDSAEGDINVEVIKSLNSITTSSLDEQTREFVFSDIATAEGWNNSEAYIEYTISPVTIEAQGGGNNGKWYTSGSGSWRMYSGGTVRISADNGYEVTSVTSSPSCSFTIEDGIATFSPSARTDFTSISVTCEKAGEGSTISNTNFNAQKAVIEFAEDFASKMAAVCDAAHGNTNTSSLSTAWTNAYNTFTSKRNGLSSSDQEVFDALIANATANESGDDLQKALASYNYIYAKYHESLTSGDFLHSTSGRGVVQASAYVSTLGIISKETSITISIIVVVSLVSLTAIGGYFFLRKRKEQ